MNRRSMNKGSAQDVRRTPQVGRLIAWSTLALLAALAWLAPLILPDPHRQDLSAALQAPGPEHWLGTDGLGRDCLARLAEATRISLALALGAGLCAAVIGSTLGLLAAWRGGWIARVLQAVSDGAMAMPGLLWVLLLAPLAPGQKWPLYLGLVLMAWVEFYRSMRASAGALLAGPQVQASRLLGFGPPYIARHHVWPEVRQAWLSQTAFAVCNGVLAVAAMGFVGVGLRPPQAELGLLMTEALPNAADAPWLVGGPIVVLWACVAALQWLARPQEAR
jgi:peptide/nickel transport system permease protein